MFTICSFCLQDNSGLNFLQRLGFCACPCWAVVNLSLLSALQQIITEICSLKKNFWLTLFRLSFSETGLSLSRRERNPVSSILQTPSSYHCLMTSFFVLVYATFIFRPYCITIQPLCLFANVIFRSTPNSLRLYDFFSWPLRVIENINTGLLFSLKAQAKELLFSQYFELNSMWTLMNKW